MNIQNIYNETPTQKTAYDLCNTVNLIDNYPMVYAMSYRIQHSKPLTKQQQDRVKQYQSEDVRKLGYVPANILNMLKSILPILFVLFSFSLQAQQVVKLDAKGNYTAIAKTSGKSGSNATATGKYFVDKSGNRFEVMQSAKGKLFYTKVAKSGNTYNVYISVK